MDVHEIIDDIYRHAKKIMQESGLVMQLDNVGTPEDLHLWCLIVQSKMCREYACPMRYSCRCNTDIRITETKQTLTLETIRVHDQHSHIGGKMQAHAASKSAPGVGGFSCSES
jgi:hypothetical protein